MSPRVTRRQALRVTRRQALRATGLLPAAMLGWPAASGWPGLLGAEEEERRRPLPVAGVVTVYQPNSHADVLLGKILEGYRQDGGAGPDLKLVSLYTDQVPKADMGRRLAEQHGFRLAKTIDEAITLGTDQVQVAGVISVGEHGTYPSTPDTQQRMYPRRRFFDQIVAAMRRGGRVVPVFNDKHLGYRWQDALHMVQTARDLKIPLMAGSSLPVAWRVPPLNVPMDCEIEAALAVGYGGLEAYGFHALETLQCQVERRKGGETGVARVQAVRGAAPIRAAEQDGRWSRELLEAALAAMPNVPATGHQELLDKKATLYLIDYRDGLRAAVAMANGLARHFGIALKLRGQPQPVASWFQLEEVKPYGHFEYLLRAIEHMIHTGRPAYPVERTLLTTGMLDAVMHSAAEDGRALETPQLDVRYSAVNWPYASGVSAPAP
jgi:hypothetical protein